MLGRFIFILWLGAACGASSPPPVATSPSERPPMGETPSPFVVFAEASPKPGEKAPSFTLPTLSGESVTLADAARERPVVLVFGSYSCPLFRMKVPGFEQLARTWQGKATFLFVFSEEAHAHAADSAPINAHADALMAMDKNGDGVVERSEYQGRKNMFDALDVNADDRVTSYERVAAKRIDEFADIEQPTTAAERKALAERLRRDIPGTIPLLLDSVDNRVGKAYGNLPNNAFVLERGGVVRTKMAWASVAGVDRALQGIHGPAPEPAKADKPDLTAIEKRLPRDSKKPVLLHFTAPGCAACREMETTTLVEPDVVSALKNFTVVELSVADDAVWALFEGLGLHSTPAFVMLDRGRNPGARREGRQKSSSFVDFLRQVNLQGRGKTRPQNN